jgi:hypothetical protein
MTFHPNNKHSLFLSLSAGLVGICSQISVANTPHHTAIEHPQFSADQLAFFEDEVRPILAEHCFKCHGGEDSKGRLKVKSGLQLISRRGVMIGGDHGSAIDLNDPAKSFILKATSYEDEHLTMPPSGKLSDAQLVTLKKWVEMKAPWSPGDIDVLVEVEEDDNTTKINETTQSFWSNKPLKTPAVPSLADSKLADWVANPIDSFVAEGLSNNNLEPNPRATKTELVRRAYLNVTGLAPTPAQVSDFVNDTRPDAWSRLVDDLLASPHYGEKWARHWMDVVRYAESNGFERDSEKPHIWRYRDWVIDAYNSDKPYDQFIREQLAGDELDEVTAESMVATGFFRLMQWDDEPADRLQHKYDVLDDIVRTAADGFLAMSIGCARCHDHKGDPVPQTDYYSFMAFFHGVTNHEKGNGVLLDVGAISDPAKAKTLAEQRDKKAADLTERIGEIEALAAQKLAAKDPKLAQQLEDAPVTLAEPILIADHRSREQKWHYTTERPDDGWSAVGFRAENAKWQVGVAPFGGSVPGEKAKSRWNTKDIWLQTSFQLNAVPSALRMQVYHDEDIEVFLNGQLIATRTGFTTKYVGVKLDQDAVRALQTGRNVVAVHVTHSGGGQFFDMKLEAAAKKKGAIDLAKLTRDRGKEVFTDEQVRSYRDMTNQLRQLKSQPPAGSALAMVVKEHGTKVEPLRVHIRGNANSPGDEVQPSFPQILGNPDALLPEPQPGQKTSGRRRVLADWMADPHNRRTSRVAVNRVWQQHFGRGICPTPSDFGYLGELPTNPELLDWLATEFVRRDWSVKQLQRIIMTSNTYQMSSRAQDKALAADPQNNLLWRFNMRRLSAEEIRDNILAVTGELNLKMGGPSFFPKLDEAVLATSSTKSGKWGNSPVEEQNRRAVYSKIKRSLKDPMLTGFDLADTDAPCPQRFTTTVPTQALNMLNSNFLNDRAAVFAKRLKAEAGDDLTAQMKLGLEIVTTKPVDSKALAVAQGLAVKLQGEHGLNPEQALERFCLVALNLNEFMFVD